jgi:AP-3 complex subunit sigma
VLCDKSESELGILDLIQGASVAPLCSSSLSRSAVYVETLDRSFESVCELDLIFNSPKAYAILDEIVMGGAVFETSSLEALRAFNELQRLEKLSDTLGIGSSPRR